MASGFKPYRWEVVLSDRAQADIEHIRAQLAERWSGKVAADFLVKLVDVLRVLESHPYAFAADPTPQYPAMRRCLVGGLTLLYYVVEISRVDVLFLRDTRTRPFSR